MRSLKKCALEVVITPYYPGFSFSIISSRWKWELWLGFGWDILLPTKGEGGRVRVLPGKENFIGLKIPSGVFFELKSPFCERYYQQYFIQNASYAYNHSSTANKFMIGCLSKNTYWGLNNISSSKYKLPYIFLFIKWQVKKNCCAVGSILSTKPFEMSFHFHK